MDQLGNLAPCGSVPRIWREWHTTCIVVVAKLAPGPSEWVAGCQPHPQKKTTTEKVK